jgi:predicted phage terminase large subunit-like protein
MAGIDIDPGFHPGQTEVAKSPARFRVLAAGRRWGKTRLGVWECLKVGSEGGRAWWVAPTYPLASEGWRPLRLIGQQWPGAKVLEVDKEIRLPGGGMVQVRSADDPQRLRGAGLDFVVVDEAAFCKEEAWTEALRPALSDRQGRAMFISTPKGLNWFYDLWAKAEGRDGWTRFRFTSGGNPYMPAGELDVARSELPSLVFRQEYLAEFVESKGARYDSAWFRFFVPVVKDGLTWLQGDGEPIDYRACERFCTVDLAASLKTSADWTVICSCAAHRGHLFVLDMVRRRMEGPDIVPAIWDQMRRHDLRVAHIESSGFQLALVQEARREGLAVKELKPDRDKIARSLPLEARMEAGQVWFPRDASWLPELQRELLAFPVGEHDDQVDALAYAAAAMTSVGRAHDWSGAPQDTLTQVPARP